MADASGESERFKSLLTAVEKCVECPVCVRNAQVPFKLCSRGHIVCLSCRRKTINCPTCDGPFTEDNPVCLKNILEALPHRCSYSRYGCEEFVEPGCSFGAHMEFCGYRLFSCREDLWPKEMPVVKVLDHYKNNHSNINIITERYVEGLTLKEFEYTPVSLFEHLFWILTFRDTVSRQLKIYFQVTPIGELYHDYYLRVTIENGDFVVTNTIKAVKSPDQKEVHTLNDDESLKIVMSHQAEELCANVPMWQLNNMCDNIYDEVKFNLFFFDKEKN